jgi:NAD(P)-dependent dehydrogenase (short-subunit alcohol dehydrogenase family)
MQIQGMAAAVTGGASGLGRASAEALIARGAIVTIIDLPGDAGAATAAAIGARFAPCDVTDEDSLGAALDAAGQDAPLRAVVHCAGTAKVTRILEKDGSAAALAPFDALIRLNLIGSFNVLRSAAARMAALDPLEGERGVVVMTASIAAYEGQIGQAAYAASKAGIVGLTLCAARELAPRLIRVATIAPGIFETPLLTTLPQPVQDALGAAVPHPARLGKPAEFGLLACQIIENPMLNGETIRLDGALRMAPR